MGRPIKNLAGQRFGKLVAIDHVASNLRKQALWRCMCDCGKEALCGSSKMQRGHVRSCGCLVKEVRQQRPLKLLESRFWEKVSIPNDPEQCWEWIGAVDQETGYGKFGLGRREQKLIGAHRFSYVLSNDFISDGLDVCHSCNNRKCVNPFHLYEGTRSDNMQQARRQGRLLRHSVPAGIRDR